MFVLRLIVKYRALAWAVALGAASSLAADTMAGSPPALPAYPDQTSVYLSARIAATQEDSKPAIEQAAPADFESPPITPAVVPVAAETTADDPRRLAPQRDRHLSYTAKRDRSDVAEKSLPSFGLPLDSMYTTGTALAVVVGLFLLCAWVVRRGARKSASVLPDDVVSVLGRVPLAARQFAELIRVGNKLVLLSITPDGAEPLTEITDPVEIDRLLGLCRQRAAHSSTAEFDQVFRQLAEEAAPDGFLGDESPRLDSRLAVASDAYAAYRGGANRG